MSLRTRYARDVTEADHGTTQRLAGWVQDVRALGAIAFVVLRDRTGVAQVTLPKKKVPPALFDAMTNLPRESVVQVEGTVAASKQARLGWELVPTAFTLLNEAAAPLPLGVADKVGADMDTRLDNRFMDLRREETQAIFKIRSSVLAAVHEHLRGQGFLEIHTSVINASSSEGGTQVFKFKYFEKDAFLAQSPQLYKQMMMATGFDRVYEIARYFRAEEHNTRRHLNEITAIDLEMAYVESEEDVLRTIEGLCRAIWKRVHDERGHELGVLGKSVEVPPTTFPRVRYDEVVERLGEAKMPMTWGDDISSEQERKLGELLKADGHEFYFITKWPLKLKPFYCMPEAYERGDGGAPVYPTRDDALSRSFDLDYRGMELLSGAQRIHEPAMLVKGLERFGLDPKDFENYLKAFRYGMPPHGGFGLGIERILMNMLELPNIREATLFPRDRTRIAP